MDDFAALVRDNGGVAEGGDLRGSYRLSWACCSSSAGEEVVTLLPFLALLQLFSKGFGLGRKSAIIGAWLVSSVIFGLIHLPTYD